jgi:hypothetical protein
MIQSPDDSMVQSVNHRISAEKQAGISLHSSQNNNVMLFSVVHSAYNGETKPHAYKHLQENCRFPRVPLWKSECTSGHAVGQQFTTKNG